MSTSAQLVSVSTSPRPMRALENLDDYLIELLHCCSKVRPDVQTQQNIEVLTNQVDDLADWQTLIQFAIDHRVLALVSHNLQLYAAEQLPVDLLEQLKYQARYCKLRVFGLAGALVKVVQELQLNQIKAVPFKGLLLSLEAYGDLALRSFDDIDIWVAPEHFFVLQDVLASQGYIPYQTSISSELDQKYCWNMGEYSLINKESDIGLDIHHRLMAGDCSMEVDFARCWGRGGETQVMGHTIPTLMREDLMIYLCANGMKDGWSYLRSVCDVAALMTHEMPLDWELIRKEAKSMKAWRMVQLGVMLAHRLLDVPLPMPFEQLSVDATMQWMCDRICKRLSSLERPDAEQQAALEKFVLRFLASESFSARWAYLGKVLGRVFKVMTHVTQKDREFLELPQRWNFLYYVIRPVRILSEHHLNLFTVSGYRMFR